MLLVTTFFQQTNQTFKRLAFLIVFQTKFRFLCGKIVFLYNDSGLAAVANPKRETLPLECPRQDIVSLQ